MIEVFICKFNCSVSCVYVTTFLLIKIGFPLYSEFILYFKRNVCHRYLITKILYMYISILNIKSFHDDSLPNIKIKEFTVLHLSMQLILDWDNVFVKYAKFKFETSKFEHTN
jgi:uncharacterized integral membrane protein